MGRPPLLVSVEDGNARSHFSVAASQRSLDSLLLSRDCRRQRVFFMMTARYDPSWCKQALIMTLRILLVQHIALHKRAATAPEQRVHRNVTEQHMDDRSFALSSSGGSCRTTQ